MTQEDKQLLLKDLCARLPYGIRYKGDGGWGINPYQHSTSLCTILNSEEPLVYLRPMSSMTEEERNEATQFEIINLGPIGFNWELLVSNSSKLVNWLNARHFDYRGLIPMGLALEAPEGMYKTD